MRNANSELARRRLLDGVGFVQDQKIIGENVTAVVLCEFFGAAEQNEQQGVVHDQDVGGEQLPAGPLIKAVASLAARFFCAYMRFAANLRPNFWIRFEPNVA